MRDSRWKSPDPKTLGDVLGALHSELTPDTPLAHIQAIWPEVVGDRIAAVTEVIDEREGTVTIACESAVWAQELELMGPRIKRRLARRIGGSGPERLRFRTAS